MIVKGNVLYVVSHGTNEIKRYNASTGAFIDNFVSAGSGGLSGPSEFTFGPDGNLYVSSFNTNQVDEYNGANGAFLRNFASGGGLSGPKGFVFLPAAVPEPSALVVLFAGGLTGTVFLRRRK